ncbi:MAG: ABC transporter ATP-binding protein [Paracoccus sp. (in: a-proteobacteria)]
MGDLKLTGVTKDFGAVRVIHPTDLHIRDGEFTVFVGPSGCGKSTMLRMIAGLEDISSGTLDIDGRMVNDLAPARRGIAMVFQSYALYPHMSVYENIAFPLRVEGLPQDQVESRVRNAADLLKLTERLDHRPGALSGGQRQRVAIGRAIVREPSVFLFDEPLSNLDAALRAEMRVELSRLHGRLANTMIYVTHDQIEAMTMADRIVVLNAGRVEQVGSPLELFHRPVNRFVAGFIGNPNMNFLPVQMAGADEAGIRVNVENGPVLNIPVDPAGAIPEGDATLGIRPDDLRILPDGGLPCRVDVVERLGSSTVVYLLGPEDLPVCMVTDGTARVAAGDEVKLGFDPADAHLFRPDGDAFHRRHVSVDLEPSAIMRRV